MKKRIMAKTPGFCSKNLIIFSLFLVFLAFILFLPGCEGFIASSSSKIDVSGSSTDTVQEADTDTTVSGNTDTSQTTSSTQAADSSSASTSTGSSTETTMAELKIKVYYANADGSALVGEERILQGSHKYLEAFLELLKPPISPGLIKLVPVTTKVNKISLKDGNIDLDLSKNFIEDRFVSDPADILLIHSVVNTLTEFKEVNTVTFYIDGGKGSSLGQVDISAPVFRDESFNQKN